MSVDLISRQAAIEALAEAGLINYAATGNGNGMIHAINVIKGLPSAEPVQVVRCKDCKWYDMTDPSGTVEPICYRCKRVNRLWREPDDFCKGAERKGKKEDKL